MTHFRAYILDANGSIIAGEDIEAAGISEAVSAAQEFSAARGQEALDHIEVWSGRHRVFPTSFDNSLT